MVIGGVCGVVWVYLLSALLVLGRPRGQLGILDTDNNPIYVIPQWGNTPSMLPMRILYLGYTPSITYGNLLLDLVEAIIACQHIQSKKSEYMNTFISWAK